MDRENPELTRRRFLRQTGGALGGLIALGGLPALGRPASAAGRRRGFSAPPFTLGVASGEPSSHGVLLWTRLAPEPLAGGGLGTRKVPVRWEVALDPGMRRVIRRGRSLARPEYGHSVHAWVGGLPSDCWLWYRFDALGEASRVGRTRTFPRRQDRPRRMRFALASCQNYQQGFYPAYAHMAEEDLDFVVHVGDYIYEGGVSSDGVRQHDGPEIQSLEDYRNRYALYKIDPALQDMHASFPFLPTWDDHEVDNNYAGDFPEDDQSPEAFLARRAIGYQAYFENMPLLPRRRPRGPDMRLFRRLRFGRLAQIHMLDTRQFRTDQCEGLGGALCPEAFDPATEMLGRRQERWLFHNLARSPAIWNVMAQGIMMMQWDVVGGAGEEPAVNYDQWDGYPLPRQRVLDFLAEAQPANPVVLTGDVHSSWVGDLLADFAEPGSAIVGSEFVGTSISSTIPDILIILAESSLPGNPHIKFFDGAKRGYVRFDVDPKVWRADYRVVESALDPVSPVSTRASFALEAGRPGVQPA